MLHPARSLIFGGSNCSNNARAWTSLIPGALGAGGCGNRLTCGGGTIVTGAVVTAAGGAAGTGGLVTAGGTTGVGNGSTTGCGADAQPASKADKTAIRQTAFTRRPSVKAMAGIVRGNGGDLRGGGADLYNAYKYSGMEKKRAI